MYGGIAFHHFDNNKDIHSCVEYAKSIVSKSSRAYRNHFAIRNVIVQIAANCFVRSNYYSNDEILCAERSAHFGEPIGKVRKVYYSGGYFKLKDSANLILDIKKLLQEG